ncbi:hypothetical protein SCLCIDRAFT_1221074 [Scleroderma citrinum Foug A]|uniref:Helicase C-terminal domain-containing protein n=1 Tax=Scleroderma citrinum Foug A TaxID=1036808 RepID=A0A0C3D3Z5_9AGAM|nr:hypothetical protein SCLCIDRAFT_1221074 [Scleroderma citrinum Foug A]
MEESVVKGFQEGVVLLPHQVLGSVWMREQESGKKRGGILADDMGLGKTIQTLAWIVKGHPKKSDKEEGWSPSMLVICPMLLVSQWASKIKKMMESLIVIEHHGQSQTTDPYKLQKAHVVITSYNTVTFEHASFAPNAKDESSKSKSKKSDSSDGFSKKLNARATVGKTRDALFRVKWFHIVLAKFRWCLTGMPMQNSVEELFSLLKFLCIQPLNEWHTFEEEIAKPLKNGCARRAMKRLHLPGHNLDLIECQFDPAEKEFYVCLQDHMTSEVNKLVNQNANVNYTHMLDYHIDKDAAELQPATDDDDAEDMTAMFGQMGISNGKKCQLPPGNDSNHCSECISLVVVSHPNPDHSHLPPDSAKIRKILEILKDIEKRSDGGEKTIIFSQFTSMLNLIKPFLDAKGIKHVQYDGLMTKDKCEASLEKIRSSKSMQCILISFKAGSTGLNLTACNNVILVDMWWNPALEDQAYNRAHRLGHVNIYKLTIPETVETWILQLQNTKCQLAAVALSSDKMKNMKLKMDNLLALFRGFGAPGEDNDD